MLQQLSHAALIVVIILRFSLFFSPFFFRSAGCGAAAVARAGGGGADRKRHARSQRCNGVVFYVCIARTRRFRDALLRFTRLY